MADNSINVTRGTGTEYVGFDTVDATGTATTVYVQWVKIQNSTATIPVSLTSLPSTATIPVTFTSQPTAATLAVVVQNTATVTLSGLPSTATIPVSVQNTATVTLTGLPTTATMPVSIQNTATVIISATGLPTAATMPVSVQNTATVSLSTAATLAVAVQNTATVILSATGLPTAATLAVAVQAIIPGTSASQLGKAEDAGHTSGDTGVMMLGIRNDAGIAFSDADLDYTPIRVNSAGNVIAQTRGFIAHDATSDTNPLLIGGYADTPADTAVTDQVSADGDLTHVKASRDGAIYTMPHPPRIWRAFYDGTAATVDGTVKAAATAAGLKHYVGTIFCGVNVGATVFLTVGTGTASQFWKHYFATSGDGAALKFNPPIQLTATQAIMVTTVATTFSLTLTGYTAP